jgi:hypothetical protein
LYPKTKRRFDVPAGVESVNGEVGTKMSPIPDFILNPPLLDLFDGNVTELAPEANATEENPVPNLDILNGNQD